MSQKIRVGVLMGGKSPEHEISLLSAQSVLQAMNPDKYEPLLIGINKSGEWFLYDDIKSCLANAQDPNTIHLKPSSQSVSLVPSENGALLVSLSDGKKTPVDVIFPVLHGPNGEDGTIQGLLKLANVAFVGAGVLGSSIAMDKDVMKRLFLQAGIPTPRFRVVTAQEYANQPLRYEEIESTLGIPCFVKPANLGSSIGVGKIKHASEFKSKIEFAFQFDHKILLEEFIDGREIECSVLGNEMPTASLPGELMPQHEFYSYEAKYLDAQGALFDIPAVLKEEEILSIRTLAVKAYQTLCCEGMARVDMFLDKSGRILLNEINTIPGFTKISMYPKMWEATGLGYSQLIDQLITLALSRCQREQALKTHVELATEHAKA